MVVVGAENRSLEFEGLGEIGVLDEDSELNVEG